ncbi:hypothetical protein [Aquamicrobium ahrensii]|uniref:Uncharacterized protein n=1 Tax=Aquamicrobium ahrensii TaxID=469551 RepID=A0ABV2KL28_9HYPH
MTGDSTREAKEKLAQARQVIAYLLERAGMDGAEGQRALDYFGGEAFDRDFLPWPRHTGGSLHPDELNAANDD